MKYKVVVTNYFVNGVKYRRGDIVDINESDKVSHGTKLERLQEPAEKPKRKRRTKAEMEAAQNEEV